MRWITCCIILEIRTKAIRANKSQSNGNMALKRERSNFAVQLVPKHPKEIWIVNGWPAPDVAQDWRINDTTTSNTSAIETRSHIRKKWRPGQMVTDVLFGRASKLCALEVQGVGDRLALEARTPWLETLWLRSSLANGSYWPRPLKTKWPPHSPQSRSVAATCGVSDERGEG